MKSRNQEVQDCIQLAHTYLMQHDLRTQVPSVLNEDGINHLCNIQICFISSQNNSAEAEREERRVGLQILSDSDKLKISWALLKERANSWSVTVDSAYGDMKELEDANAEAMLEIGKLEDELFELRSVEDLLLG
jgi:hypothetical protein